MNMIESVELEKITSEGNRKNAKDESFEQLVNSIKEHGILEPPVVRKLPAPQIGYKVVAGRRRVEAVRQLNKRKGGVHAVSIDCMVIDPDDPRSDEEIALAENVNRLEMHPLDEAATFKLMADKGMSAGNIAKYYARSPSAIYKRLRLAGLSDDLKGMFRDGKLGIDEAALLAELPEEDQKEFFEGHKGFTEEVGSATVTSFVRKKQCFAITEEIADGCAACAKRTHNNGNELFEEYSYLKDACLDGDCYRRKWREMIEGELASESYRLGMPPTDGKVWFSCGVPKELYKKASGAELFFEDSEVKFEVLRENGFEFSEPTKRKKGACWEVGRGYDGKLFVRRVGYKEKPPRKKQAEAGKEGSKDKPSLVKEYGREIMKSAAAARGVPAAELAEKLSKKTTRFEFEDAVEEKVFNKVIEKRIAVDADPSRGEPQRDYFSPFLWALDNEIYCNHGLADKGMDDLHKGRLKSLTGSETLKRLALSIPDEAQPVFHYLLLILLQSRDVPSLDDLKGIEKKNDLFWEYAGMTVDEYRELYLQAAGEVVEDELEPKEAAGKKKKGGKKKAAAVRKCRVCGCTDEDCSQCVEKTGEPCYWVEDDLCSACVNESPDDDPDIDTWDEG